MKIRVITGIILTILAILVIWFLPAIYFTFISGAVFLLVSWEWANILGFKSFFVKFIYLLGTLFILSLLYFYKLSHLIWLWTDFVIAIWAMIAIWKYNFSKGSAGMNLVLIKWIIGWVLLPAAWLSMNLLRLDPYSPAWLFFGLVIIWVADSGAYFAGRIYGQRPLASRVSPKKTWEGFWGGLILAMIAGMVGLYLFKIPFFQWFADLLIILVVIIFSVIGDLLESMLKRQVNLKDSGSILPGHGGFLDRLDGVLLALPLFALGGLYLFHL